MSECMQASNSIAGGRQCDDCEEAAKELLWCEKCGVALCFECDSHCHHGKSLRSSHLRLLLASVVTLSPVPGGLARRQAQLGSQHRGGKRSTVGREHDARLLLERPASLLESSCFPVGNTELRVNRNSVFDLALLHSPSKDKRKKENPSSPTNIHGFNNSILEKVERKSGARALPPSNSQASNSLFRSATFPAASTQSLLAGQVEDSNQDADTSDQSLSSSPEIRSPIFVRSTSLPATLSPRKSALRGGYEEKGLGPRPKLHVQWHPDVFDPVCSTISHTLGHNYRMPLFVSRRSYQKHLRHKNKACSNSQVSGKKQGGSHEPKKISDTSISS